MSEKPDKRKVSYATALDLWRTKWNRDPGRKPSAITFGLSKGEAAEVERYGYEPPTQEEDDERKTM